MFGTTGHRIIASGLVMYTRSLPRFLAEFHAHRGVFFKLIEWRARPPISIYSGTVEQRAADAMPAK